MSSDQTLLAYFRWVQWISLGEYGHSCFIEGKNFDLLILNFLQGFSYKFSLKQDGTKLLFC